MSLYERVRRQIVRESPDTVETVEECDAYFEAYMNEIPPS